MKICVTGGSGMVGKSIKNLSNILYKEHEFVFLSSKNLDLRDRNSVLKYFNKNNFTHIIHLAAIVGGLYKNMNNNISMFTDNILINQNILEACNTNNINRGIFCLSSCIYPFNPSQFPMDETMIHESPPHYSNEGYAYSKRMLEILTKHYNQLYNREYICVIPVNLYGPYDNFSLEDGHFIPMVMNRFYKQLINKDSSSYIAYGSGKPLRQFLYAPDFANLICKILLDNKYNETSPIICCNDDEYTISDVVNKIGSTMNFFTFF